MTFTRKNADLNPIQDEVFKAVALVKEAKVKYGKDNVIDATIGTLCSESGEIVALKTVFDTYDKIDPKIKASYSSSFTGNPNYCNQVAKWVFGNSGINLPFATLATPGGTGAISTTFQSCLNQGETILLPEVAWGSYKLMANQYGLEINTYKLFDKDVFNLVDFADKCHAIVNKQQKLVVVINDPCHNPTGYSLTINEWENVIAILNECSKQGPVVLLNDIAYIDYSYDLAHVRDYMHTFNNISDNVAIVIAFSCSKTCTSYGLRIGASIILAKQQNAVREMEIVFEKLARSTWSNVGNAGMENFVRVTIDNLVEFEKEKNYYVDLLKERSDIFVREAAEVQLPIYPYKEGFFVTIMIDDNEVVTKYHQALIDNNIFAVKVNKGIRVAICSVSVEQTKGLAKRMSDILKSI